MVFSLYHNILCKISFGALSIRFFSTSGNYLYFLSLDSPTYIHGDDSASVTVYIPGGFPFGGWSQYYLHVRLLIMAFCKILLASAIVILLLF